MLFPKFNHQFEISCVSKVTKSISVRLINPYIIKTKPTKHIAYKSKTFLSSNADALKKNQIVIVPEYPWRSRMLGEEGTTLIHALINHLGLVENTIVKKSSSYHRLDLAALSAIAKLTFPPTTKSSFSTKRTMDFTITFKLNN